MAFYACTFRYDGISSEEFGLTLCEIASNKQNGGAINDGFSVLSDHMARRSQPIHYGVQKSDHLEFDLIFGADEYLDRTVVADIAKWLLGRSKFAPLVIEQEDMKGFQYKAIITTMKIIPVGGKTIGFSAHVVCDGPFAYTERIISSYKCEGVKSFYFRNLSNVPELYAPDVAIILDANSDFKMVNNTTGETVSFEFDGANTSNIAISIHGKTKVMTYAEIGESVTLNLYECMTLNGERHFVFPRFAQGDNLITVTGNCTLKIESEFPMAIGT